MPWLSAQFMSDVSNALEQSVSPNSPVTTGYRAATGATSAFQQLAVTQPAKL